MYGTKAYKLTADEYYYILPALGRKNLSYNGEENSYTFTGGFEDLEDMLNRLKGLYGYFDDLPSMVSYNCSKKGTLEDFRKLF